jgi:hypothetical protein
MLPEHRFQLINAFKLDELDQQRPGSRISPATGLLLGSVFRLLCHPLPSWAGGLTY